MKNAKRRQWNKSLEKRDAVIDVLKYIMSQPAKLGERALKQDAFARKLFEDPKIGNIDIPADVKVVFVPSDERKKKAKGSVVLELPRPGPIPPRVSESSPDPMLAYVLCCYTWW
jgi:hypothetical protein